MIEGRQIRAARGLLGWSRSDLIEASGVSLSALLRLESAQADSRSSTLNKVIVALNAAGYRVHQRWPEWRWRFGTTCQRSRLTAEPRVSPFW